MVRKYKKKGIINSWDDSRLEFAKEQVLKHGKAVRATALEFGIPRSTLQKKISNDEAKKVPGKKKFFSDAQENALCEEILEMEERFIGLTTKEVRRLAYDFAEEEGVKHNFSLKTKLAGKDWLRSFMHRNNLSHRTAEFTSSARTKGFNKKEVDRFFTILKKEQEKYNFNPANIYNCDETGISVNPKCQSKIVAKKGRRRVGGKTTAERGQTVTAEICFSASGTYLPPMLIFPRVKENKQYLIGKPPNAWAEFKKSGWMEKETFTKWFEWFLEQSHASLDNRVLLLFDGHYTHVRNLRVIRLAREHGVSLINFPPHCTHRMQPCDVVFMKPLSSTYTDVVINFQRDGRVVQMKDIFYLFGIAFQKAAKLETAVNGFKCTGIYPLNEHIFDKDFSESSDQSQTNQPENPELQRCKKVLKNITSKSLKSAIGISDELENPDSGTRSDVFLEDLSQQESETFPLENANAISLATSEKIDSLESSSHPMESESFSLHSSTSQQKSEDISSKAMPEFPLLQNNGQKSTLEFISPSEDIKIPVSFILAAKPFIQSLSSFITKIDQSNQQSISASDNLSVQAGAEQVNLIADLQSNLFSNPKESLIELPVKNKNSKEKITIKKSRKRGAAALITDDDYYENLIIEESKKVEKEVKKNKEEKVKEKKVKEAKPRKARQKPVVKSDLILQQPLQVPISTNQTSFSPQTQIRTPLVDYNYQNIDNVPLPQFEILPQNFLLGNSDLLQNGGNQYQIISSIPAENVPASYVLEVLPVPNSDNPLAPTQIMSE